ncbi:MAG: DegT/DnrJ/EryC1/StrS family aminotransferase [Candidatus Hydrogenedentales bacterium]|jgi:dTDP-4-amino-4,6-dideoxygalactose transaminase
MAIPLLDLQAQYRDIREEVDAAVAEVFSSQQFIGGPKVESVEQSLAKYLGVPYAVGVASGTDALLLLLKAAGAGPGTEVITSPFTFFATAGTVSNAGARPVFVDIEPRTFNIDVTQIEAKVTERTRAIIPVHLFGQCADMDPILDLAERHNLIVIEDAAQAIGARYKERPACSMGHAGTLSFFPSKNLGGAGDGGMVITRDAALDAGVRLLRNHGASETYFHQIVGTNSRLGALQAAVLLVKQRHLDRWSEARRANAAYYDEQFAALSEVVTPYVSPDCHHVYNQYVIRIPERERARQLFAERGIGCAIYYPRSLHRQECFLNLGYPEDAFPYSNAACDEVLALPVFPELTREQQDEVVGAVKDHLRSL